MTDATEKWCYRDGTIHDFQLSAISWFAEISYICDFEQPYDQLKHMLKMVS